MGHSSHSNRSALGTEFDGAAAIYTVIGRLDIGKSATVNGGAGKLTVKDGSICNLELDMGVGNIYVEFTAE